MFQCDWLMAVNFFARHTYPQSSTIGDNIDTALASSACASGGNLLGNQFRSHGVAVGTLHKEMQDLSWLAVEETQTTKNVNEIRTVPPPTK
jgi:hypothetical protein